MQFLSKTGALLSSKNRQAFFTFQFDSGDSARYVWQQTQQVSEQASSSKQANSSMLLAYCYRVTTVYVSYQASRLIWQHHFCGLIQIIILYFRVIVFRMYITWHYIERILKIIKVLGIMSNVAHTVEFTWPTVTMSPRPTDIFGGHLTEPPPHCGSLRQWHTVLHQLATSDHDGWFSLTAATAAEREVKSTFFKHTPDR